MSKTIIDLKHLNVVSKDNLQIKLVNDVSLTIEEGKIVGVVGESGSGKSLTMKSMMQLLPDNLIADYTTFKFNGKDVSSKDILPMSMIFQDPMTSLNPLQTIGFHLIEVIMRYDKVTKSQAFQKAINMLEKVGIPNPNLRIMQYPFELSGGMRQRVMIAMALLAKPKVLIADEPTTALDVTIQLQILSLIFELQKELGLTVIIVSHDFGVIASMCEEVVVMYQGQIVEHGTIHEIFHNAQHDYTKKLLSLAQFDTNNINTVQSHKHSILEHVSPTHVIRVEVENE